jgi:hypothetical protein
MWMLRGAARYLSSVKPFPFLSNPWILDGMPTLPHKKRPRIHTNPDHQRRTHAPAPSDAEIEARLTTFVQPAVFAELAYYRHLGMRNRILHLPVMLALILGLVWRRVAGVCALQRLLARERILWADRQTVSQSALSDRFLDFPAVLVERVLYRVLAHLPARFRARTRPTDALISGVNTRFAATYALDATTLEPLFRKLDALQEQTGTQLAGHVSAAVDLQTQLPAKLWWTPEPQTNEKAVAPRIVAWVPWNSLLVFDMGYFAYWFFDAVTEAQAWWVTRQRDRVSFTVERVLLARPHVRDQIIRLGQHKVPCRHPVRLVEVYVNGHWRGYLTNVLDPQRLSVVEVVALYHARWRIETMFLLVKRLLDLAYLWVGSQNGVWLQVLATFLFYAVLIDLCDDVAEVLGVRLDQVSVEMVYRSLYHYVTAVAQGDWTGDAPSYFAQDAKGLGIRKRERARASPSVIDQIRWALVAPPLSDAELTP